MGRITITLFRENLPENSNGLVRLFPGNIQLTQQEQGLDFFRIMPVDGLELDNGLVKGMLMNKNPGKQHAGPAFFGMQVKIALQLGHRLFGAMEAEINKRQFSFDIIGLLIANDRLFIGLERLVKTGIQLGIPAPEKIKIAAFSVRFI